MITSSVIHINFSRLGCDCPFFVQYAAPCTHALMVRGVSALEFLHPAWRVSDVLTAQPEVIHVPRQERPVPVPDKSLIELIETSSYVHSRLLNMDTGTALIFAKQFREMLDKGTLNASPMIQDPPVVRSRGRPRKRARNNFKDTSRP